MNSNVSEERKEMYIIGLTGGVGSGKTEAAKLLQELSGAELLLADELGHLVMKKGTGCYEKIVERFGNEILAVDGEIDRKHLSELVFHDSEKLQALNDIVHPAVLSYMQTYIRERKEKQGFLILESAIMFESGCDRLCDEVWYISVSREIRERRLLESRGYSSEKSSSIITKQM
ncbi:MAG: dephospho-CoA kinase, partial [Lachnospiraceae bacterium]|nr:dephospho-CoA kinase [Lachnospiraceae bacterium]